MSGPFTPGEKREIVVALLSGRTSTAELCRQHQVGSTALYEWRNRFLEGGLKALHIGTPTQDAILRNFGRDSDESSASISKWSQPLSMA